MNNMRSVVAVLFVVLWGNAAERSMAAGAQAAAMALEPVRVSEEAGALVVTLRAAGVLDGTLQRVDAPARIFVDLANIRPGSERVVPVRRGGVKQVRIALNRSEPPLTRVVIDLDTAITKARIEPTSDRRELRIVFAPSATSPSSPAAPRPTAAAPHAAYVAWFTPAAARITRLLDDMVEASSRGASAMEPILAEWMLVEKDLAAARTPAAAESAHALLVEAARLGRIAATRRAQGSAASAEAIAGESGARLLLDRARAAVVTLSPKG